MSVGYYIPEIQAEYIKKAFNKINTTEELLNKINKIIEHEGLIVGINYYEFNNATLNVLNKYKKYLEG